MPPFSCKLAYSLFSAILLLGFFLSGTSCNTEDQKKEPALGVPIPEFNTVDDTRQYVSDVINATGETDYTLPEGILADDYAKSNENLNNLYPEFYGKHGGNLMEAVKAHPYKYQEMIRDVMALRDHFNPEWRAETNKKD